MAITARDVEIVRTLARVQFATTARLSQTFFSSLRHARRRLSELRNEYGLIATHDKGLPGSYSAEGGYYWRLTEAGLDLFIKKFPDEFVPENLISRCKKRSLSCFRHVDDSTDLYLSLIGSKSFDIEEIADRASRLDWRGEHEYVLNFQAVNGAKYVPKRVIPDATLTTPNARYFLEVDRSTESLKYCKETLHKYANAISQGPFKKLFPDNLPCFVVFVTKSKRRAVNLRELIAATDGHPYTGVALPLGDAIEWLWDSVESGTASAPALDGSTLSDQGVQAVTLLRALYSEYRGVAEKQLLTGHSPALMDTFNFLKALEGGR